MARPEKEIDMDQLDKLVTFQCTLAECANFFEVSEDTIQNRVKKEKDISFSVYKDQKAVRYRLNLKRKQYEVAMAGNVAMLIFLGKNYLGQSDKTEVSNAENKPFLMAFNPDEPEKSGS